MTPGVSPRISFEKLLFRGLTEGEGKGEARGILLPGHDAVLDGFFYHLQGRNTGIKSNIRPTDRLTLSSLEPRR